jgi:hypothetical protein
MLIGKKIKPNVKTQTVKIGPNILLSFLFIPNIVVKLIIIGIR